MTALDAPFPKQLIKSVTKGGVTLSYVPVAEIIARLNDALGVGKWSYTVMEHFVVEDFVVVRGRLTVGDAHYEQFGGVAIKRKKDGTPVDLGDEAKGAASDALKKCAQCLGVGLELARSEEALRFERKSQRPPAPEGWESEQEAKARHEELRSKVIAKLDADQKAKLESFVKDAGLSWPYSKDQWGTVYAFALDLLGEAPFE